MDLKLGLINIGYDLRTKLWIRNKVWSTLTASPWLFILLQEYTCTNSCLETRCSKVRIYPLKVKCINFINSYHIIFKRKGARNKVIICLNNRRFASQSICSLIDFLLDILNPKAMFVSLSECYGYWRQSYLAYYLRLQVGTYLIVTVLHRVCFANMK